LTHYFGYIDAKLAAKRSEQVREDGYHSFHVLKQFDKAFGEDENSHLSRKTLVEEY